MSKIVRTLILAFILTYVISIPLTYSYANMEDDISVFEDEEVSQQTINNQDEPKSIFELQSKSAILTDAGSGQVLFEKNSHERLAPASVTKVMSLLLFLEAIDKGKVKLDEKVTCSEHAAGMGGSQIFLEPGEQMTVDELLKSITVASGNDATVALAEHTYGSSEAFINAMNEKAKQLGMKDTNFVNATGLDADNHYTSAHDIAIMSGELLNKHPLIHKYTTIWMDTVRNGEFGLANTNKLIRFYRGCDGLKTGSTSKALFCVSISANRNGLRLITVIMAAPTSKIRFAEASKLLDHGFANYSSVLVGKKGDAYGIVKVAKGTKSKLDCIVPEDVRVLVKKGEQGNIERIISLEPKIQAPIQKGQKVGEVELRAKNQSICKFNLVAKEPVSKATFVNVFGSMFNNWYSLGRQLKYNWNITKI